MKDRSLATSQFVRFPLALLHINGITCSDIPVLMALSSFCRPGKMECWPAKKRLAEIANVTTRHVVTRLNRLEKAKLIRRQLRDNQTTIYNLTPFFKLLQKGK